ncbi:Predicted phage recombinase, RecA/RadA family [Balnearium lithotrophicum]|uniref:Predicted phage recombinase, RecA/RadA family n=1 Tax=Balnearium lithotrophicum TaxID=223788 RepID=A0A521CR91_9BACT|nr:capsid cement protein [Balnearium lithotrophicum]SMO61895.1 Predicted phage recombinase, RecA/RadA family [Balnearium lithotrophicum]
MKNYVYEGDEIVLNVGTGKTSGTPVAVGNIVGVLLTDSDSDGNATVVTRGVFSLPVKGSDGTNNVAVAVGDKLYIKNGVISKDASGVFFGYALGTVTAGATETIEVKVNC